MVGNKNIKHWKTYSVIASSLMLISLLSIVAYGVQQKSVPLEEAAPSRETDAPTFTTLLPNGSNIKSLGGWKKISPPETDPVYAFTDEINGISVTVSEQSLPASFKNDADGQLLDLSEKFNATNKLDVTNAKAYIGTSAKGPQSVILTKNNLLILIKSQQTIQDNNWIRYINSLN
jgi:hypothetical protein